ncbi:hotdog fold thioesterase, partial [Streptococcus pyogenes]
TLGSMGAAHCVPEDTRVVGLEINANHLRSVTRGWVTVTARPVHIGRSTQVWQIEIANEAGEMVCLSRLTMAVLPPR